MASLGAARESILAEDTASRSAYLVSRLQALLQTRRLHLPDATESRALVDESLDSQIRLQPNAGTLQAGALGTRHDDLATALGLAVLQPQYAAYVVASSF